MFECARKARSSSITTVPRPALVLDLDETLIHCAVIAPRSGDYFQLRVRRHHIFIQRRPGLAEFLARVRRIYDLFFFTASSPEYADPIINKIAPDIRLCRRFFRDSYRPLSGYLVKDLSILRRPLTQTLLVDDVAGSALAQPANLMRIRPWMGDPADRVLMDELLPLLESLAFYSDLTAQARQTLLKGNPTSVTALPSRCI
jgi:Dullard-like phosphatase family protein